MRDWARLLGKLIVALSVAAACLYAIVALVSSGDDNRIWYIAFAIGAILGGAPTGFVLQLLASIDERLELGSVGKPGVVPQTNDAVRRQRPGVAADYLVSEADDDEESKRLFMSGRG
ncbi:hypothetical protein ACETK8_17590 [Brevundimonas staleyi]|uniref:Uncharacterized protein n=1 Tax=Brevundimonas staleyi TaxID=74326 RepID=A0ABW0FRH8_9CAUL